MPLRLSPSSSGSFEHFRISWESFVQLVLQIMVEAYQEMRQDRVAQQDWEEDTFTVRLTVDYIQSLMRQNPLALTAQNQVPVYTPAMKTGKASPKQAPKIDICLSSSWRNYNQIVTTQASHFSTTKDTKGTKVENNG